METFVLTRKKMSRLLLSLYQSNGEERDYAHTDSFRSILEQVWTQLQLRRKERGDVITPLSECKLPPILAKLLNDHSNKEGLSLNEIVALGNQVEYTNFSLTSIQNWVKRDIKPIVGPPHIGKKYSLQQAALILIVEDLRATLSLEAIRQLLEQLFQPATANQQLLINPLDFYAAYSSLYEELDQNNDQVLDVYGHDPLRLHHDELLEKVISQKTEEHLQQLAIVMDDATRLVVRNALVIAITSVQTTYFQHLAKMYWKAIVPHPSAD
ncbi:DUF1836 domain-containing protein [Paenibacillus sp. 481]|uniref:DUF1836 domain-containing protein n=1 Tax=Paenibacillus sp. 481 TaxID=2835869 RepID=UPI001E59DCE1|nr:DUF1836 domain-containing protein [Paenibacillus sp. 481]UHA72694.1 DUF1836 domain-containing protein [Paenibacillus sp. 481]